MATTTTRSHASLVEAWERWLRLTRIAAAYRRAGTAHAKAASARDRARADVAMLSELVMRELHALRPS